jgi:hypothetical protein
MKAWPLMLAIVPFLPTEPVSPGTPVTTCALAIVIDVRAPLAWGDAEWHLFTREVERTWTAYGLTFCWVHGPDRCEGLEVRVRVSIADNLPSVDTAADAPSLGRIRVSDGAPLGEIELSLAGASRLCARARLGGRPVASWPGAIGAGLLPRVLGRGLAHEIGHFILQSREHAATGLMAPGFTPDEVAWGDPSRFTLAKASALAVRSGCEARQMAAR